MRMIYGIERIKSMMGSRVIFEKLTEPTEYNEPRSLIMRLEYGKKYFYSLRMNSLYDDSLPLFLQKLMLYVKIRETYFRTIYMRKKGILL